MSSSTIPVISAPAPAIPSDFAAIIKQLQGMNVAVHAPYEDAIIAGFTLIGKLIDGQTPEQKAVIWQGWIDFWNGKWFKSL